MDINMIKELAQLMHEQQLGMLEYSDGTAHVRMESGADQPAVQKAHAITAPVHEEATSDPGTDFNEMNTVNSPMVGVFYSASTPDAPAFVKVGDKVKKGDVLCIVEAMKLMNEITSEYDGQVVDICVYNGDVVEFGQTLFKLI